MTDQSRKKTSRRLAPAIAALLSAAIFSPAQSAAAEPAAARPLVEADGVVHVPAFDLPLSAFMSEAAKKDFIEGSRHPPAIVWDKGIARARETSDANYFGPLLARAKARYPVDIAPQTMGGVAVNVITPSQGVSARNRDRVLINLHGGGFVIGAGLGGLVESVPIAGRGAIKVVSVDYRQGPEHQFPAASEDVAAVYKELLKHHRPQDIGIYGCSAGGILAAEAVAWFAKAGLPRPGAIGVFCAAAFVAEQGDSSVLEYPLHGYPPPAANADVLMMARAYFGASDLKDPLVSPGLSPEVLARFPPTLLITGTRAADLSPAAATHARLVKAGVEADLHVWDGMGHAFLYDVRLPESEEAFDVTIRFFDRHLGAPRRP